MIKFDELIKNKEKLRLAYSTDIYSKNYRLVS